METSETTFSPDLGITRAQVVTFLYRLAGSPAQEITSDFVDLPSNTTYAKAISWAYANGIRKGTSVDHFSPSQICTREQIAAFIYRYNEDPAVAGTIPFTDVRGRWSTDAVNYCYRENITTGYTSTLFLPTKDCTREQVVVYLYRMVHKNKYF